MLLLADENVHADLVAWLRDAGHDVVYVAESMSQAEDDEVLDAARTQHRVVVTDDLDLGELVYRQRLSSDGVLLMRLAGMPVAERIHRVAQAWPVVQRNLPGRFVVITADKVRVRPLPPAAEP